ncbi:DUF2057 domain-containing protein [Vibrio methylphosphonaticus]|uniref:DUF2057 domain-containing protein n=1 Tax=Vibrio methylphosphonaticus TaxID=2946866 RepID=UPI00202A8370|nr:DUF2057 domain-containing protein [Vibrio methylphosphonaticus]MCL9773239.1 DUF2057 domain-containing protein [Vibrio methylphosphonaticus]
MLRKAVVVLSLLLGACSSLDSKSDFSKSVESVGSRGNERTVIGKNYNPVADANNGADIVKSQVVLALSKNISDPSSDFSGYVNMEVSYFKSYTEFEKASYLGKEVDLVMAKPSTSICTEHCTATQYFSFPVDSKTWEQVGDNDFVFNLVTNNSYQVTFKLAAGYISALKSELLVKSNAVATIPAAVAIAETQETKPVSMVKYWYEKSSIDEQEKFMSWALSNRKSISSSLSSSKQSEKMLQYWYGEASVTERQYLLTWMIGE